MLTIVYKKFVHSNSQIRPEIQPLDQEIVSIVAELGNLLERFLKMEIQKSDAFLQYKTFELNATWRLLEDSWAKFKRTEVRSHDYSEKRRCLKSAM